MIQITPALVSDELRSMFHLGMPTGIRALAVLAGGNTGKILTDNPVRPHWCLVWEADDGTLYRGGEYDDAILNQAVNLLRQDGIVALGFRDGDPDIDRFPPEPDAGAECLEFDRSIGSSDLSPYLHSLPYGYSVQRMDRALLERSPGLKKTSTGMETSRAFWKKGSPSAFCTKMKSSAKRSQIWTSWVRVSSASARRKRIAGRVWRRSPVPT